MSIVRERDYHQAKRRIPELEKEIATAKEMHEQALKEDEFYYWGHKLDNGLVELKELQAIVADRESTQTRPCDVERPANEASLDQWVSA